MSRQQQKQGYEFERVVATALNELQRQGRLKMVTRFVNAVGTPADFLLTGHNYTYLLECKALVESKRNKAYTFPLRHLTDNEWCGMRAWVSDQAHRQAWVVWSMKMLDGQRYFYAVKFSHLDVLKRMGQTVLPVGRFVEILAGTAPEDFWQLFEKYEGGAE